MSTTSLLLTHMRTQADLWENNGDQRFVFLRCYSLMTENMHQAVLTGRFSDGQWVEQLLQGFAGYYFEALDRYEATHPSTPAVWRQVHEASRHQPLHVLQHLLLGINAHINYDLVLALCDGLGPEWAGIPENVMLQRKSDHELVNRIIGETIDTVQDLVLERQSPVMALVDRLMGRVDEWLLSQLIASWRGEVWHEACHMLDSDSPENKEKQRLDLERNVMERANQLLL